MSEQVPSSEPAAKPAARSELLSRKLNVNCDRVERLIKGGYASYDDVIGMYHDAYDVWKAASDSLAHGGYIRRNFIRRRLTQGWEPTDGERAHCTWLLEELNMVRETMRQYWPILQLLSSAAPTANLYVPQQRV